MKPFEQGVTRDINLLTGFALLDAHNAFTRYISEHNRLIFGFNDDVSVQAVSEQAIKQFFITELGDASYNNRVIAPQVVIARDIAGDLSRELGWQIGIIEDYHLGSMTQAEQAEYFAELPERLLPIDPEDLDIALTEMSQAEELWYGY